MSRRDSVLFAPQSRPKRPRWAAFLDGMRSIFDIYGLAPWPRPMSDAEAHRSDWAAVGHDMWVALANVAGRDDELRIALAREAGQNHDLLTELLPVAAREDPRLQEVLRAAADRQKWFQKALESGGEDQQEQE